MGIVLKEISKSFGKQVVLKDLHLEIQQGEFHVILGPSGEGKSTLLSIIAGLIQPDRGEVRIRNTQVTHLPPEKRNIGFVFQDYALFPHLNVFENVAYGLRAGGYGRKEVKSRAAGYIELVKMEDYQHKYPACLSGGQKQRVAIARALAIEPEALLLDEPLSHLDLLGREHLRNELKEIQNRSKITTCYVTHDQKEAMALADRVSVLHKGRIEQIETPDDVFYRPKTPFVAEFVGAANILNGRVRHFNNDTAIFDLHDNGMTHHLEIEAKKYPVYTRKREHILCLHPEKIFLAHTQNGLNSLPARIINVVQLGAVLKVTGDDSGIKLNAIIPKTEDLRILQADNIWFCFPPDAVHPLCGRACRAPENMRACSKTNLFLGKS